MCNSNFIVFLLLALNFEYICANKQPNIILILTDDQDVTLHGMFPMRQVQRLLADKGATLLNAFTSSPLCCPSRASVLSGFYAHNHGTKNNSAVGGCYGTQWREHIEASALPVLLQNAQYSTFFAGKYLNEYRGDRVPAGWQEFHGLHGNSRYFNYTLRENEKNVSYTSEYFTDVLRDKALEFLRTQENAEKPFFAMIAPPAPHEPFTPAERHKGAFAGVKALRTPSFNVVPHATDKHWLMTFSKPINSDLLSRMDDMFQHRWESLLAVDELVADLVTQLKQQKQLDNTYIIYTSDNGYHIGQFAQPFDKRQPYETDIRIPLVVRGPGIAAGIKLAAPALLIDLLPTILDWAQLPKMANADGISLQNYLLTAERYDALLDKNFHRSLLVQYWGEGNMDTYNKDCPWTRSDRLYLCTLEADCHCNDAWNNTYACVRHFSYNLDRLYCEFQDHENFVEIYDVGEDPYQLSNIVEDLLPIERAMYSLALNNLTRCSGASCANVAI